MWLQTSSHKNKSRFLDSVALCSEFFVSLFVPVWTENKLQLWAVKALQCLSLNSCSRVHVRPPRGGRRRVTRWRTRTERREDGRRTGWPIISRLRGGQGKESSEGDAGDGISLARSWEVKVGRWRRTRGRDSVTQAALLSDFYQVCWSRDRRSVGRFIHVWRRRGVKVDEQSAESSGDERGRRDRMWTLCKRITQRNEMTKKQSDQKNSEFIDECAKNNWQLFQ